jgi:hypothetical protein
MRLKAAAAAMLRLLPPGLQARLRTAYLWNTRSGIYGDTSAETVYAALTLWQTIGFRYGFLRSLRERRCLRADGTPIPWFTYPAIEFLEGLDLSAARVFEYGAGNSTRFWAAHAKAVDAVEADAEWYRAIAATLPAHCSIVLAPTIEDYVSAVRRHPQGYDVIVVDGKNEDQGRFRCAQAALEALRPGGMIVLDNADCLPESRRVLRDAGLIEVPMCGFNPLNGWAGMTTFFLRRDFAIPPRCTGPYWPIGAPHNRWEGEPHEIVLDATLPDGQGG